MALNPYAPPTIPSETPPRAAPETGGSTWAITNWIPFGLLGFGNLLMHVLGHYDPRTADFMDPRLYPIWLASMIGYVALSAVATLVIVAGLLRRLPWRGSTIAYACWASQVVLWLMFILLGMNLW